MITRPGAPASAVSEIVKVFRGQWYPTDAPEYTTAQFNSKNDLSNAFHLVKMLPGWSAEIDPDQKLTLRVLKSS